jgi:hypothetical protein
MIKPLGPLFVALLVAAPASAQVATVPVQTPEQFLSAGTNLTLSVGIFGYTSNSSTPRILSQQTINLPPLSLLERQVCAEFPGYRNASMTMMQLVLKSSADGSTFHSDTELVTPKQPLSIKVNAGKKAWAVYSAPQGQQATLRFYVSDPPTGLNTQCSTIANGPSLSVGSTTIAPGGTVTANWSGIVTPSTTDWIGLYTPAAANESFIDWIYVSCAKAAGAAKASGSCSFVVPATVARGTYQLRLLANDGYTLIATSANLNVQ